MQDEEAVEALVKALEDRRFRWRTLPGLAEHVSPCFLPPGGVRRRGPVREGRPARGSALALIATCVRPRQKPMGAADAHRH